MTIRINTWASFGPKSWCRAAAYPRSTVRTAGNSAPTIVSSMVRHEQHGQTAGALGAVNDHALDVAGRRRPRHEQTIRARRKADPLIRVMHRGHDHSRIELHHEVLRKDAQRVHDEVLLCQPHRPCLRHAEMTADDADLHII